MKKNWFLMLLVVAICTVGRTGWAAEAYVTDSFEITFRTGPGVDRKIIATLRSGDPVEVLESGEDWSRVRVLREGLSQTEGWVLSRYLMTRQPWEVQAKALLKENGQLKMRLESLQAELREVTAREKSLQSRIAETGGALEELKQDYRTLKEGSSDFLNLKREHEEATSSLQEVTRKLSTVAKENEKLKSMQQIKWFGMGALVLLFGLLIGVLAGRAQRKRKLSYY